MEMNRELDKKIAELKEEESCQHIWKGKYHGDLKILFCEKCKVGYYTYAFGLDFPNKEWSTNISDAWELWEELPIPKGYWHGMWEGNFDETKHIVSIILSKHDSMKTNFSGTSFPLAVCKAWVAWKEKTKIPSAWDIFGILKDDE